MRASTWFFKTFNADEISLIDTLWVRKPSLISMMELGQGLLSPKPSVAIEYPDPLSKTIGTANAELVERMFREALEDYRKNPPPPVELPKGIHYTELPEVKTGHVLASEWSIYRREVGRLLAAGHEGKFVLIKGTNIVGLFDSWGATRQEGLKRYLLRPMLIQEIRTFEPILRCQ